MEPKTKKKLSIGLSLLAAILYVIVPTDLIPDIAPVAGWIDDVVAILLAVANTIRILKRKD